MKYFYIYSELKLQNLKTKCKYSIQKTQIKQVTCTNITTAPHNISLEFKK